MPFPTPPGRSSGKLESDKSAIVAHDKVGGLVAGIVCERRHPTCLFRAVQRKLIDIDMLRILGIVLIALDQRVFAVGEDAFRLSLIYSSARDIRLQLSSAQADRPFPDDGR